MSVASTYIIFTTCFIVTFLITGYVYSNNSNRLFYSNGEMAGSTEKLIMLHCTAFVLLGIIPLLITRNPFFTIVSINHKLPAPWILLFVITFIFLVFTGRVSGKNILIRKNHSISFSQKFLNLYYPVRILFLGAYELFFRGFLLFELNSKFGVITSITVSTMLTVLIHVFTNKKEMLACIPFGITLSLFCISINAVWPAIILHIALSFSYELPAVQQFHTHLKPAK